jgi:hypothetical protein
MEHSDAAVARRDQLGVTPARESARRLRARLRGLRRSLRTVEPDTAAAATERPTAEHHLHRDPETGVFGTNNILRPAFWAHRRAFLRQSHRLLVRRIARESG